MLTKIKTEEEAIQWLKDRDFVISFPSEYLFIILRQDDINNFNASPTPTIRCLTWETYREGSVLGVLEELFSTYVPECYRDYREWKKDFKGSFNYYRSARLLTEEMDKFFTPQEIQDLEVFDN